MEIKGLTEQQVKQSRQVHGSNKLPEPKQKTWVDFLKDTLSDSITRILIVMAAIFFLLAFLGVGEISEPIMILVVLGIVCALNIKTGLGIQKSNNELKAKTAVRYCNVLRDGSIVQINKDDIVVGDIVCLEMGQEIFADGYIVEGAVSVSNAAINGETKECHKAPVENYHYPETISTDDYTNANCLFAGTTVMSGEGKMLVTNVGINTVNGDTLVKMQTLDPPKTALDIALDKLADFISKWGTAAAVAGFVVTTCVGIAEVGLGTYFGGGILEVIRTLATNVSVALTIIVAAVPEGLPLIVKLVTKMNVKTMEKANILTKNPGKIPEMAYLNYICTDKTGTLTTGIMTPKAYLTPEGQITKPNNLPEILMKNIVLTNGSFFESDGNITGGNSIDRAMLSLTDPSTYTRIASSNPKLGKQAFNSQYKYSAFSTQKQDGVISYYKGAPEKIIEKCKFVLDENGKEVYLSNKLQINDKIHDMTTKAMRCIAFAYSKEPLVENQIAEDLVFLGVIGVQDPVRVEVPDAVKAAQEAGITIVEITGDCIETAIAVAKEAGIFNADNGDLALTDSEFVAMTDEEVKAAIPRLRVIARCSPQTKLRLVSLAQGLGYSVGMTGDGTNDSPALKKADVGFAMNAGTDVAKEAGDIILTDNNFASIVRGVKLGRTFMHNIMMFLNFQLPINYSLLILNLLYPIFFVGSILTSVLILVVNIIMDSLNSLSFGGEPPKDEYMKEKPLTKGHGLFVRGSKKHIAINTIVFTATFLIMLFTPINGLFATEAQGLSARFALLCIMAVLNGFTLRTDSRNLLTGLSKNKLFYKIAIGIVVGTVLLVQFGAPIVHTAALTLPQWSVVVALSLIVLAADFIRKTIEKGGIKNGTI